MNRIIDAIEKEQFKTDAAKFKIGDGVRVHTRVVEGDKERIQIFAGIVIGRKGRGLNETFTVRRISYGEGVERVFPVHSPRIALWVARRILIVSISTESTMPTAHAMPLLAMRSW